MTEPAQPIHVLVVPMTCDYQIVLDNAGAGVVLATCDKAAAAMALVPILRGQTQETLADLWERC